MSDGSDRAEPGYVRRMLISRAGETSAQVVDMTRQLIAVPSENPPGDTGEICRLIAEILRTIPGIEIEMVETEPPISNIIARLRGARPGRRLVLNGHLDTFPAGDGSRWSVDPFGGEIRDGKLYGRGAADMKAGLAASIFACRILSEFSEYWDGELVLTFAGDEETMGDRGTRYLLERFPYASGDAMISGDAGSPSVLRFGEKGLLWMELTAKGRSSHGAHVHLGESAIEHLIAAMQRLTRMREISPEIPREIDDAIRMASARSEELAGAGESDVLRSVTVNFGTIAGGNAPNLVADQASASVDIRLPVGVSVADIEREIEHSVGTLSGISYAITNRFEATWTDPASAVVTTVENACREVFGAIPYVNMRVGASDSRHYREWGIPTVVCGATPHGMGGADEYVDVDELGGLGRVFALAAFDFLSRPST